MIPVVNVKEPSEWTELFDIEFKFDKEENSTYKCQNIITYDIETSNGFIQDNIAYQFDHDKYNTDEEYKKLIDNSEPASCLYVWQFAIEWQDGIKVFIGRTWDEYIEFIDMLTKEIRRQAVYGHKTFNRNNEYAYSLHSKHNVIMYQFVHNLGFEYQHLRNIYNDDFAGKHKGRKAKYGNVFARQARKPMKARIRHTNKVTIELRDTLVLTQKSLSAWCKDEKLPIQKLEEPKDYYLEIRTPLTKLTQEEIQYSINDVVCMVYGIEKYRDKYEHLDKIPLTQTGITRALLRKNVCEANPTWAKKCCDITKAYTPEDFKDLVHLFQGGWTHGNKMYINRIIHNCRCFDLASSYPSVLSICTFPVGQFIDCNVNEFNTLASQDLDYPEYRWYAKIKFTNVRSKLWNSYWSLSKVCKDDEQYLIKGQIVDNGRIYKCDEITVLMTDLDYDTWTQCYSYDTMEVQLLRKSEAGFMPKEFILTILDYFKIKTSLKGDNSDPTVESKYRESKSIFNAFYGCSVTKIVTDQIDFEIDGWNKTPCDDNIFYDAILSTKPEQSFSCYQHGIWVTSHARHNLFQFIINLDKRIAYCDTDSIKGPFNEKDIDFIKKYNIEIEKKQEYVANYYGFDKSLYTATTMKGKVKRLGIMEEEDPCSIKVLGAKRYVELLEDDTIICTIAGLPKSAGNTKIKRLEDFNDKTFWNTKESEKLMAVYNDKQTDAYFIDRDGNKYLNHARYGICLQPTTFDLSMGNEFRKFLEALDHGMNRDIDEFYNDTTKYLL